MKTGGGGDIADESVSVMKWFYNQFKMTFNQYFNFL